MSTSTPLTTEQKVALAAGPKNFFNLGDTARTNMLVRAAAPTPRPTPNLTREAMTNERHQQSVIKQG